MTDAFPLIVIGYFIVMAICIWLIYDAFMLYNKLLIFGIGGSTIILFTILRLAINVPIPESFASTFLGASFPVELLLCATPSILILSIAGLIDKIKWIIKDKRSK